MLSKKKGKMASLEAWKSYESFRNEYGLKLSLAERRAAQAESELFKLRQSTKAQEESDLENRRNSQQVDRSPKIDPLRTERSDPIGAERDGTEKIGYLDYNFSKELIFM